MGLRRAPMAATIQCTLTIWTGRWTTKCRTATGSPAWNRNMTVTTRTAYGGSSSARFKKIINFDNDLKKRKEYDEYTGRLKDADFKLDQERIAKKNKCIFRSKKKKKEIFKKKKKKKKKKK